MRKIMGENAAELYDIDIDEKKRQLADDDVSDRFGLQNHYSEGATAD
jgi:hypothetical protein